LAKICQGGFDSWRHVVLPVKCESHNLQSMYTVLLCFYLYSLCDILLSIASHHRPVAGHRLCLLAALPSPV